MANENFQLFGDVVSDTYDELSVDSSTNTVPGLSQTQMESWANRYSKIFLEKVKLRTQEETHSFLLIADTTLSAAASSGASSVAITSATGYPTTGGLIFIEGDPYEYSSISGTTVTLSGTLSRDFASGAVVQPGYALPTDFGKPRSCFVDGRQFVLQRYGDNQKLPWSRFSIYKAFSVFPESRTAGEKVILHYVAKGTNTLTSASTMEIYQMWDSYVIYRGVARGHRLLNGGLETIASRQYEQLAQEALNGARQMIASEDNSLVPAFTPGW